MNESHGFQNTSHSQLSLGQLGERGGQKKSLILGLSHWVCRVNPHAGPSVVLLPSDVTARGLAAATETREGAGLVWCWNLLNSVM